MICAPQAERERLKRSVSDAETQLQTERTSAEAAASEAEAKAKQLEVPCLTLRTAPQLSSQLFNPLHSFSENSLRADRR